MPCRFLATLRVTRGEIFFNLASGVTGASAAMGFLLSALTPTVLVGSVGDASDAWTFALGVFATDVSPFALLPVFLTLHNIQITM